MSLILQLLIKSGELIIGKLFEVKGILSFL